MHASNQNWLVLWPFWGAPKEQRTAAPWICARSNRFVGHGTPLWRWRWMGESCHGANPQAPEQELAASGWTDLSWFIILSRSLKLRCLYFQVWFWDNQNTFQNKTTVFLCFSGMSGIPPPISLPLNCELLSSDGAFAALAEGRVIAWGDERYGGEIPQQLAMELRSLAKRFVFWGLDVWVWSFFNVF